MKEKTLNPDDFKRAIQAVDALGATPAVLLKVAELARDPNTDLATISAVLRHDGPLAADIIRISNSPYYAPATFHSNLTSAINFIGLREVVRVVNLSLSRQLFARDLSSYGISANDYWSASIAAALVMEALAKLSGLNPEDAYTIGILHAIGRVLINRVIEEQGFTIYWDNHEPIADWNATPWGSIMRKRALCCWNIGTSPPPLATSSAGNLVPRRPPPLSLLGSLQFAQRLLALTGWDFAQGKLAVS